MANNLWLQLSKDKPPDIAWQVLFLDGNSHQSGTVQPNFHGGRYARDRSLLASASLRIVSWSAFHLIFRPTSVAFIDLNRA